MKRFAVVVVVALVAACISRNQRPSQQTPAEHLLAVLTRARVAAAAGQHNEADGILARFVQANPSTPEAREATYWRAILQLEAARSRAERDAARRYLDSYLTDTAVAPHVAEARIIRRLLVLVDSMSQATDSATAAARQAAAREEELRKEIQSLKEQLEKTNDELNRIKRRLGSRP